MRIDDPEVVAEVEAAFAAYEAALLANDVEALDGFFWPSERAVRYGQAENQYGHAAIAAFRAAQRGGMSRRLDRTVIATFGRDFATASTLFRRDDGPDLLGRQTQAWVRLSGGWRIVAAHVSAIDAA